MINNIIIPGDSKFQKLITRKNTLEKQLMDAIVKNMNTDMDMDMNKNINIGIQIARRNFIIKL